MATIAATVSAVYVINLRRRFSSVAQRLANLEASAGKRDAEPNAPSLNVFCQQLMDALGMELPGAISSRMSPDDPARFIRALTIYTRAQRRRLVALYRQAESLREVLNLDGPTFPDDRRHADRDFVPLTHPENDSSIRRPPLRKRDKSQELQLAR